MTVSARSAGNVGTKSNAGLFVLAALVTLALLGLVAWALATIVRPGNSTPSPANTPNAIRGGILPNPQLEPDVIADPDYAAAGNSFLDALSNDYPSEYESLGSDTNHPYAWESWQHARLLVQSGNFTTRGLADILANTQFTQDQMITTFNNLPLTTRMILTNPSILIGAP